MVRLTKIYTKTGDDGTSALGDGTRLYKDNEIFDALGTIDEANAAVGVASSFITKPHILEILKNVQNQMFDLGADVCTPGNQELLINQGYIDYLEEEIDKVLEYQQPLTSFILPSGGSASAQLHLARAVVRRAERTMWTVQNTFPATNPLVAKYLNRLSDLLFVLARECSINGDVLWVPNKRL